MSPACAAYVRLHSENVTEKGSRTQAKKPPSREKTEKQRQREVVAYSLV
jgi:hypothetical protein